jgi:hypothetical protein
MLFYVRLTGSFALCPDSCGRQSADGVSRGVNTVLNTANVAWRLFENALRRHNPDHALVLAVDYPAAISTF